MTPLSEELDKAVERAESGRHNPEENARMKKYVDDARERGILRPKEYDIPLIDTIGRGWYKSVR